MLNTIHTLGVNVSQVQITPLHKLDRCIVKALNECKDAKIPQGLIVSIMKAYAWRETGGIINNVEK